MSNPSIIISEISDLQIEAIMQQIKCSEQFETFHLEMLSNHNNIIFEKKQKSSRK